MNIYKHSRKLALSAAIAMTFFTGMKGALASEVRDDITEARQESQIWTTYGLSPYLRAHNIKVSVNHGKATLTGKVDEEVNKELAKQIALGVSGIKEVDNQLVVDGDYTPEPTNTGRSYGEMVDDASISTVVKSKLLWSKEAQGISVNVETKSGKVTLLGTADSAAAKELAGVLANNTHGVVSVNNKLVVDPSNATVAQSVEKKSDKVEQVFSDSWITTKVKSTLMYSSNVNSSNISVSTKNGVVSLSGKVNSGAEHALALKLANNVRGVKSVNGSALTH